MLFRCGDFKKEALQSIKGNHKVITPVFFTVFIADLVLLALFQASSYFENFILILITYFLLLIVNASVIPFTLMRFSLILSKNQGNISFQDFTLGFKQTGSSILCMLWSGFWTFLWSLLFIIPGYVKYFAYSQAFFILADNPSIAASDAVSISNEITYGNKSKLLLLEFSFFGWFLLVLLTWGLALASHFILTIILGIIIWGFFSCFLMPYYFTTKSKAYVFLRQEAIRKGNFTPANFGLVDETVAGDAPNL